MDLRCGHYTGAWVLCLWTEFEVGIKVVVEVRAVGTVVQEGTWMADEF